jgi:hypothetical protein
MEEYHRAFAPGFDEKRYIEESQSIRRVAKKAATASGKTFATEKKARPSKTRRPAITSFAGPACSPFPDDAEGEEESFGANP